MRRLGAAILLAMAFVALPALAQEQLAYTSKDVHLRAGPGREYPVVAILPTGTEIYVQGCLSDYSWCDVIAGVDRGWVYAANIDYAYQDSYYPVLDYGAALGIGVIGFTLFDYWGMYYPGRPFYRDRDWWVQHPRPPHQGGPGGQRPPPQYVVPGRQRPPPPQQGHPGGQRPLPPPYGTPGGQRPAPPQQGVPGGQRPQPPHQGSPGGQHPAPPQYGIPGGQRPQPPQHGVPGGQRPPPQQGVPGIQQPQPLAQGRPGVPSPQPPPHGSQGGQRP
jgi:uncharacterized protein YraI